MIATLLQNRASVRKFQNRSIPEAVIREMLEAARLSPSGGNEQPWAFGVITDPGLIAQIARLAHGQEWIAHAPLLVVLCTVCVEDARGGRTIQLHRYYRYTEAITEIPQMLYWALNQEEHQTKIPGTHMVLTALEHGIGSCWVSRFDVKKLAGLLKLPFHYLPSEILAFGYPEEQPKPRAKKGLDEIVFWNVFEKP